MRSEAFHWLDAQTEAHGEVLPRTALEAGFLLDGVRVPLVGPQGIFKPRVLPHAPLSITTSPRGPYDDAFSSDGLLQYRYHGSDPRRWDNQALRYAMENRLPLVYFHGVVPGKYIAAYPVLVIADDPRSLTFTVDVEPSASSLFGQMAADAGLSLESDILRRRYAAREVRVRLHQQSFRERVLNAYHRQCAFCRLRHEELLEAAHIVPDSDPMGEPLVANGMALCSLHHGAFDRAFIGIRPDYIIQVRPDILREKDGPTLAHAIQALHGQRILLPHSLAQRPDPALLEIRYGKFLQAS